MRIEKNFYTEYRINIEKIGAKCQREQKTRYEIEESKARNATVLARIFANVAQEQQTTMKVLNKTREAHFYSMVKKIIPVAKAIPFDLVIDADEEVGKIQLSSDNFYLLKDLVFPEIRAAFFDVFTAADDIDIRYVNSCIQLTLSYTLFDIVPKQ